MAWGRACEEVEVMDASVTRRRHNLELDDAGTRRQEGMRRQLQQRFIQEGHTTSLSTKECVLHESELRYIKGRK